MSTKLSRNNSLLISSVGNEVVMMNLEDEKYYGLNDTGSFIWNLLETPKTLNEIYESVKKYYNENQSEMTLDIQEFIDELITERIINVDFAS